MSSDMVLQNGTSTLPTTAYDTCGNRNRWLPIKLLLDRFLAAVLLILTAPIMMAALLAVRLSSRGPVFYSQVRVGRSGVRFRMHKIRSMQHNCEELSGPQWSQPGDPRVTRIGRFLRRTHLDELPQLYNVLKGEMSLVGPRPERPSIAEQLEKVLPRYRERLLVPPGITGLAQIQLDPDSDLNSVVSKLSCDLYYVRNLSVWLDFGILVSTLPRILGVPFKVVQWPLRLPALHTLDSITAKQSEDLTALTVWQSNAMELAAK